MEPVTLSIGSNMGDRHRHLRNACAFLQSLSEDALRPSPIYITEPVGPSDRYFLNAIIRFSTSMPPMALLQQLKEYEHTNGRAKNHPRWTARTIDLDIISYGNLVIEHKNLIIPHPSYHSRLFVLQPLRDVAPDWVDPKTGDGIDAMIDDAPALQLKKTALTW